MDNKLKTQEKVDFPLHKWQEKSTKSSNSAKFSSEICQKCGFCCSGVLFSKVAISKNAHDRLPDADVKTVDNRIKMSLPCSYFKSCQCSVYEIRPYKCTTYSCALLDNIINGKIRFKEAKKILKVTKTQVEWLIFHFPIILKLVKKKNRTKFKETTGLHDGLYAVYQLLSNRLKENETPTFSKSEYQFCLCALDFLKGTSLYFEESSLLLRYNKLIVKMDAQIKA